MLVRVLSERRTPTPQERSVLAGWPGWGATPELFDDSNPLYSDQRDQLRGLWSEDEWSAARRTVLNAHYTDPAFVAAIWDAVTASGFSGGEVLEPGSGSGNFIAAAPAGTRMTGIELDPTTAAVSRLLHPEAEIRTESFAATTLTGPGFDAVVGNVPFGQVSLFDKAYNPDRLSMHNHFIVKSLRFTKPGGIVALLTSRWTLDSEATKAREVIAGYGTLLGAVRLPAGAHTHTAGTDVITDLLVFRRNSDGETDPHADRWVMAPSELIDGQLLHVNQYFLDHPEHVLGRLGSRMGQFGPEVTVTGGGGTSQIANRLREVAVTITRTAAAAGDGWAATSSTVTERPVALTVQDHTRAIGHLTIAGDGIRLEGLEGSTTVALPAPVRRELAALLRLRDAAVALLDEEATTAQDAPALGALRGTLNREYDDYVAQFGPINRVTTTYTGKVDEDGDQIVRRVFPRAVRLLREDPHAATVMALELFDEDSGTARKSAIFTRRVVGATVAVARADGPADALAISLDRTGRIDLATIAELLDVDEAAVPAELGALAFPDPTQHGQLVVAAEYLSGNVRQKLNAAVHAAETDAGYLANVAALEKVIPVELGPAEIDVRVGAHWVPAADMRAWLEDVLRKDIKACEFINGTWDFTVRGNVDSAVEAKWGVKGDYSSKTAPTFVKAVMNNDKMEMTYTVPSEPRDLTLVDAVGTEAMSEKNEALGEHFQDWLWAEPERAARLQTLYNDKFNALVLRSYAGTTLTLPGKAASFTPRPHQHEAVARMVAEESVGLFHEVGAGKTAEMVLGVMELKRLGMVGKPAIVVPNNMLEQFTREFKQIYPRAKVLAAGSDDMAKSGTRDGRRLFVAKAATGDWDAVILTQGSFKRISLGAAGDDFVRQQADEYREAITALSGNQTGRGGVKTLEAKVQALEERLKKATDVPRDPGVTFEQSGIDYLCIDEAHGYKNLAVPSSIPDFGRAEGSQKATDLAMKLWYLRTKQGRTRVATLATATPIANSLVEMYVMQKYLRPDMLAAAGVATPDGWAMQFTQQIALMEQNVASGFTMKTRTAKFRNVPELLTMWHAVGDVKTAADLRLPTPLLTVRVDGTRVPRIVALEPTRAQTEGIAAIAIRAGQVKQGLVAPTEDNMLKISSDGRSLAIDSRLMAESITPDENEPTMVDRAAREIMTRWRDNADRTYVDAFGDPSDTLGALQLVFADRGTPNEHRWDVYNALKAALIERGMPAHLVAFIHDAKTDDEKAALFHQCRTGQVAVIIGSTEKMGTGTNIQDRAIALHHLDCPWRPSDVTQREGRIIRQGNQNSEVEILRYVTEGSFAGYMWQTVTRKARFIDQVMGGKLDVREIDDLSDDALSYAEITAIAAGDMRILEKVQLDADIQKAVRQERAFTREQTAVGNRLRDLTATIDGYRNDVGTARSQVLDGYQGTAGDTFTAQVRDLRRLAHTPVKEHTDREDAGIGIQSLLTGHVRYAIDRIHGYHQHHPMPVSGVDIRIGSVSFDAGVRFNPKAPRDPAVVLRVAALPTIGVEIPFSEFQTLPPGNLTRRIEQRAASIPSRVAEWEQAIVTHTATVAELETMAARRWGKADHLADLRGRRDALVAEMTATPVDPPVATPPGSPTAVSVYGDPTAPRFGGPGASPTPTRGMRLEP